MLFLFKYFTYVKGDHNSLLNILQSDRIYQNEAKINNKRRFIAQYLNNVSLRQPPDTHKYAKDDEKTSHVIIYMLLFVIISNEEKRSRRILIMKSAFKYFS